MKSGAVSQRREDRRSMRTRETLHQALFSLMIEKRYDAITVQDIIERANVGRSTFYAHFEDKEALATSGLQQMIDHLSQDLDPDRTKDQRIFSTLGLFKHVQEHNQIFRVLVVGRGLDLFYAKGQSYMSQKVEARLAAQLQQGHTPAVPLPVLAYHVAGTLVTLLKWWLDNKLPYTPERMDEIFQQLVTPTVQAALGTGLDG